MSIGVSAVGVLPVGQGTRFVSPIVFIKFAHILNDEFLFLLPTAYVQIYQSSNHVDLSGVQLLGDKFLLI